MGPSDPLCPRGASQPRGGWTRGYSAVKTLGSDSLEWPGRASREMPGAPFLPAQPVTFCSAFSCPRTRRSRRCWSWRRPEWRPRRRPASFGPACGTRSRPGRTPAGCSRRPADRWALSWSPDPQSCPAASPPALPPAQLRSSEACAVATFCPHTEPLAEGSCPGGHRFQDSNLMA